MNKTLKDTLEFIKKAHQNQFDKGGVEYWKHPFQVMQNLSSDATMDEKHSALLHDVLEDTAYTKKDLKKLGYNDNIISIVEQLTRPSTNTMSYKLWINIMVNKGNKSVIRIKIADIKHNTDQERMKNLNPEQRKIQMSMTVNRYAPCLKELEETLKKLEEGIYE